MPIMLFDAILIQPKKANVMQPDCYAIIFFCLLINQNSLQIRDNMEMKYDIEICSIDSLIIQYIDKHSTSYCSKLDFASSI